MVNRLPIPCNKFENSFIVFPIQNQIELTVPMN